MCATSTSGPYARGCSFLPSMLLSHLSGLNVDIGELPLRTPGEVALDAAMGTTC